MMGRHPARRKSYTSAQIGENHEVQSPQRIILDCLFFTQPASRQYLFTSGGQSAVRNMDVVGGDWGWYDHNNSACSIVVMAASESVLVTALKIREES